MKLNLSKKIKAHSLYIILKWYWMWCHKSISTKKMGRGREDSREWVHREFARNTNKIYARKQKNDDVQKLLSQQFHIRMTQIIWLSNNMLWDVWLSTECNVAFLMLKQVLGNVFEVSFKFLGFDRLFGSIVFIKVQGRSLIHILCVWGRWAPNSKFWNWSPQTH